jgi:hypothetical protein
MPDPSVRDLLLQDVDELAEAIGRTLEAIETVTDQLEPDRAASCRVAIGMTRVGVDAIRLRAHTRPLDEPEPS